MLSRAGGLLLLHRRGTMGWAKVSDGNAKKREREKAREKRARTSNGRERARPRAEEREKRAGEEGESAAVGRTKVEREREREREREGEETALEIEKRMSHPRVHSLRLCAEVFSRCASRHRRQLFPSGRE